VLGVDPKLFPAGKSQFIFLKPGLIPLKCAQMRFNVLIRQNIGIHQETLKTAQKMKMAAK